MCDKATQLGGCGLCTLCETWVPLSGPPLVKVYHIQIQYMQLHKIRRPLPLWGSKGCEYERPIPMPPVVTPNENRMHIMKPKLFLHAFLSSES